MWKQELIAWQTEVVLAMTAEEQVAVMGARQELSRAENLHHFLGRFPVGRYFGWGAPRDFKGVGNLAMVVGCERTVL